MKRMLWLFTMVFAIVLFWGGISLAGEHSGRITLYHLNADFDCRGVCIRMDPGLPGTGWACLWKGNNLYQETTDLLLEAYIYRKTCKVVWDQNDQNNHLLIRLVECR